MYTLKVELKGKYVVKAHTNRPTGIQYTLSIRGKNKYSINNLWVSVMVGLGNWYPYHPHVLIILYPVGCSSHLTCTL